MDACIHEYIDGGMERRMADIFIFCQSINISTTTTVANY